MFGSSNGTPAWLCRGDAIHSWRKQRTKIHCGKRIVHSLASTGGQGVTMDAAVHAFNYGDPREQLGPHGTNRFLTSSGGLRLFAQHWPTTAASPKGVVIACHGHGCYVSFEFLELKVR